MQNIEYIQDKENTRLSNKIITLLKDTGYKIKIYDNIVMKVISIEDNETKTITNKTVKKAKKQYKDKY